MWACVMPRFDVAVASSDPVVGQRAVGLLPTRFPEIDLVERHPDEDGHGEVWTCVAPGRVHVERWCRAAEIPGGLVTEHPAGDR